MRSAMDKFDNFLLLQLPYVAIREVLSTWNPFELVNFSLINVTTKKITKSIKKWKGPEQNLARITIGSIPFLSINTSKNVAYYYNYDYEFTDDRMRQNNECIDDERTVIQKYFASGLNGFFEWCEYVLDVLNMSMYDIIVDTDNFRESFENQKAVIDWLSEFIKTIEEVEFTGAPSDEPADEIVSYFLENIKVTESIHLYTNLSEQFRMEVPNSLNRLAVEDAKWMTMQQVKHIDTPVLIAGNTNFSNEEVKDFLQSWMLKMSNFNLRYFQTDIKNGNSFDEIMRNLKNDVGIAELFEEIEDDKIVIIRSDGKRATVSTNNNGSSFSLEVKSFS